MSTSWKSQICNDEGKYYIQFETDNKELYKFVEASCHTAMDIDRKPEILDEFCSISSALKLPKYHTLCKTCGHPVLKEDINSDGVCTDCDKLQQPEDYNNNLSPEEFVEIYCHNCGSQRCEGIGTVWFQGCKYQDRLKGFTF